MIHSLMLKECASITKSLQEPKPGDEAGEINELSGMDMRPIYEKCFEQAEKLAE